MERTTGIYLHCNSEHKTDKTEQVGHSALHSCTTSFLNCICQRTSLQLQNFAHRDHSKQQWNNIEKPSKLLQYPHEREKK